MKYALIPVLKELDDYMDAEVAIPTMTSNEFFHQGDLERDKQVYEFVWRIYQINKGVKS